MGRTPYPTHWTQLLLVPPSQIRVALLCDVHGPTSTVTYSVAVTNTEADEEVAVVTHVAAGASALPALITRIVRDQIAAARVAVSPF